MKPILNRHDLKEIHEIFLLLEDTYSEKPNRLKYFLATSKFFSQNDEFEHEIALKLKPYGGMIGIDNSSWDKHLKNRKILRLHAILHDAGGFIEEIRNEGPDYSYMLPFKLKSCFSGHVTGILFCLYLKYFHSVIFQLLLC